MKQLLVGLVFFSVFLLGCQQATESGPIKIGSIMPITGDIAAIGLNTQAAIELAVEEINADGGINGRPIELIFEDGKCGPKDAVSAVNKLINIDQVTAIVGAMCSSETLAAAPIAEAAQTVMVSPCSSSPDVTNAGDFIFRVYPSDSYAGIRGAEVAFDDLEARNAAILYCLSDWCVGIKEVFQENFLAMGGAVLAAESYEQADRDLRTQLTKIKDTNPDVIYFVGYTEASIVGLKQIKELGIDAELLGADAWDDPTILTEAGEAAEGIMWVNPASPLADDFVAAMEAKTGGELTICSPQGYDAAHILANVMRDVGTDRVAIKDALYGVADYNGVSGVVTFDENGDLAAANYEVKKVVAGEATVVG